MQVDEMPSPRRRTTVRSARKVASSLSLGLERNFEAKVSMTPPARLPGHPSAASPFGRLAAKTIDFPATEAKRHALPRSQAFGPFAPLNGTTFETSDAVSRDETELPLNTKVGLRRTVALQHGHLYTHNRILSTDKPDAITSRERMTSNPSTSLAESFNLCPQGISSTPLHPRRRRIATTPVQRTTPAHSDMGSLRDQQDAGSSSPTSLAAEWRLNVNDRGTEDDDQSDEDDWSPGSDNDELNTLRPGTNFSCRRMSGTRSVSTSHQRQHTAPSSVLIPGGELMARSATTSSICECGCGTATHTARHDDSPAVRKMHAGESPFKTPNKRRARVQGSSSSLRSRNFSTASPVAAPVDSEEGSLFGSASSSSIHRVDLGEENDFCALSSINTKRRSIGSLSHWQESSTPLAPGKKPFPSFATGPRATLNSLTRISSDDEFRQGTPNRFAFDDSGVALQSPAISNTPLEKRADKQISNLTSRTSAKLTDDVHSSPSKMAAARRASSEHQQSNTRNVVRERSALANETQFSDEGSSNNSTPEVRRNFSSAASVPERLISPPRGKTHSRSSLSSSSLAIEANTAPYLTPQTYKNVVPLQAAFMSTGLASKRSRPIVGNLDPLTGETLPPLPAKLTYGNAGGMQTFQSSGNMAASLGLRDVVAAANAHAAASANVSVASAMPDTPIKRPAAVFGSTAPKGAPSRSHLNVALSPQSNDENDSSSGGSMCGGDSPLLAQQGCESPTLGLTSMSNVQCRSPMSLLESVVQREQDATASVSSHGLMPSRTMTSSVSPTKGIQRKRSFVRQSLPNQLRGSEDSLRTQVMARPLSLSRPPLGLQRKSSFGPASDQAASSALNSPLFDVIPSTPTRHSSTIKWYEAAQLVSTPSPSHRSRKADSTSGRESWQANGSVRGKGVRHNSVSSASVLMPFSSSRPYSGARKSYFETRFSVQGVLGTGEFSRVDKVEDKVDGMLYAVKRMKRAYLGPRDRLRRLEEVDILRYLGKGGGHPNIVAFLDAWEEAGHLFVQTELCPCVDFSSFLQHFSNMGGSLDEARLWKVMGELKDGLGYIHDMNVLHLDLKPANIFITELATLKIGDFGLATRWPPVDGATILEGAGMGDDVAEIVKDPSGVAGPRSNKSLEREGDREYIAPEIIQRGAYGKPADVFSLGLVMLEAAGNVILPDNGDAWQKLRNNDLSDVDLSQFSVALNRVIQQCLQSDPKRRPTVEELERHPVLQAVKRRVAMGVEKFEMDQLPIFDLPSGESTNSLAANLVHRTADAKATDGLQDSTDTEMTMGDDDEDDEDIVPCTPRPHAFPAAGTGPTNAMMTTAATNGGIDMERTSSNRSALGLEGVEDDEKVLDIRGALIYENLDFLLSVLEADPDPQARMNATGTALVDSWHVGRTNTMHADVPTISVNMDEGEGEDEWTGSARTTSTHAPIRASPLCQLVHSPSDDMEMDA